MNHTPESTETEEDAPVTSYLGGDAQEGGSRMSIRRVGVAFAIVLVIGLLEVLR